MRITPLTDGTLIAWHLLGPPGEYPMRGSKFFTLIKSLLTLALTLMAWQPMNEARAAAKLNVVLILADDLGWTDLACYGSDLHETPNLDLLAKKGMRFTQNYSACTVCSPTRAALMTGKYPARLHITDWIPGAMPDNPRLLVPDWTKYLPLSEKTIASHFQASGYKTASIGKWHLGTEDYYPQKHGFNLNLAGTDKPQPPSYFSPWKIPTLPDGQDGEYLTDRLANEAAKVIEQWKAEPFFLYLPHFAVHTPIQGRADLTEKYKRNRKEGANHANAAYAAMVESLDSAVGTVMQAIEKAGIADRTILVFTSDNGGRIPTTSNKPLRFGKASAYEGGVRVPLIISWPEVTRPGSICETPVITMDLFRTLHAMVLGNETPPKHCDGENLEPLLREKGSLKRDGLFWHYPHHQHYQQGGTMPYSAMRFGDWKLIEFFNDGRVELYNLKDDLGEQKDLASTMPDKKQKLYARLKHWRQEVDAQMPIPNPNHDPKKPEFNPDNTNMKKKKKS